MYGESFKDWWPLHLRAARGETLEAKEKARYEHGLRFLHKEENLKLPINDLRRVRTKVAAAAKSHSELLNRCQELEEQLHLLEAAMDKRTRELLGVED